MIRARWKTGVLGAIALAAGTGCKQQLFLDPADYQSAMTTGFPAHLETRPDAAITPVTQIDPESSLPTVLDPTRPPQYVSLKQCIAIGLEQGNVGLQGGVNNAGFGSDTVGSFTGRSVAGTDNFKALVLDPALAQVAIERSLSKFDARWISSMTWQNNDAPTPNLFANFNVGDRSTMSTTLAKPLPTGGVAGITWSVDYTNLTNAPTSLSTLNKYYTPKLQFSFEQPLMQGFGIEINQLTNSHPGSQLIGGLRASGGTTTEGILISRIRFDQQRAEFDKQMNQYLLNIESAYWNLYAAYYNLFAAEEVLIRSAYLMDVVKQRVVLAQNVRTQQFKQTEAQYFQLRLQVVNARQQVLTNERQLRSFLGMRTDDKVRLVPADEPNLSPLVPNHYESAMTALAGRPELMQARQEIKAQQLNLLIAKNNRRPDIRFISQYDIAGIGARLDGNDSINALTSFRNNQFNSWTLGIRADIPIGFRDAQGAVREGFLNIQRSYFAMAEGERKAIETVYTQVQQIVSTYEQIKYARAQRESLQESLRLDYIVVASGSWDVPLLNQLLINQQSYVQALANEFRQIAEYNKALASLEWAKGTIQQYNNVSINEGALPAHVQKKAADHFKQRDAALVIRNHPVEIGLPDVAEMKKWEQNNGAMVPPVQKFPAGDTPKPANPAAPTDNPIPVIGGSGLPAPIPLKPMDPVKPKTDKPAVPAEPVKPMPTPSISTPLPVPTPVPSVQGNNADSFNQSGTVTIPPLRIIRAPVSAAVGVDPVKP